MNINNLVGMSNQIGTFFESMPDRRQALADIASHLRRYWAPPMRRQLLDHAVQGGDTGLKPIVLEALLAHQDIIMQAARSELSI
jgi:formate dehydrogenase subunit delta